MSDRDYTFGSAHRKHETPAEFADWPVDVPRPYLAHIAPSCGLCHEDHRLGVVLVPTEALMEHYADICVRALLEPDDQPEVRQYWMDLIGAELRYRYAQKNT